MRNPDRAKFFLQLPALSIREELGILEHTNAKLLQPNSNIKKDVPLEAAIELVIEGQQPRCLWIGHIIVESSDEKTAKLCVVVPDANVGTRSLDWSELPDILDIFDGGYEPVASEAMGRLLDDLTEFTEITVTHLYEKTTSGTTRRHSVKLEKPDPLHTLSGLLLTFDTSSENSQGKKDPISKISSDLCILQIDLFERTYFLVVRSLDVTDDEIIIGFTNHCYVAQRRNGRRMAVTNTQLGYFRVLDVGDFGLRVAINDGEIRKTGSEIFVPMPSGFEVPMRVVSCAEKIGGAELRLFLEKDSPEIRRHWQQFVQKIYYPNLEWRTAETYETVWNLYEHTGYFGFAGDWIRPSKKQVYEEWEYIDESPGFRGSTVVGRRNEEAKGTIGISRLTQECWSAQAAAMSNNPEDLSITRNLYSWRTRAILMQPDGEYHIAIFDRDKRFLQRFFKKFYLQCALVSTSKPDWDEWHLTALRFNPDQKPEFPSYQLSENSSHLLNLISTDSTGTCTITDLPQSKVIEARPFLHICQFFSSQWSKTNTAKDTSEVPKFEYLQPFYTRFEKREPNSEPTTPCLNMGWNVVWICPRPLLQKFEENSLRSLESMFKKYGVAQ